MVFKPRRRLPKHDKAESSPGKKQMIDDQEDHSSAEQEESDDSMSDLYPGKPVIVVVFHIRVCTIFLTHFVPDEIFVIKSGILGMVK